MGLKTIPSGHKSFDRFIGGGFQRGYPWLLVSDDEAEGIAVSAACILSFTFVGKRFPTFIGATRHSWVTSMESYDRTIPKTAELLRKAAAENRLVVANFFTKPSYRPKERWELYFNPSVYPSQLYWDLAQALESMKASKKPLFWRLTSLSDLAASWPDRKIMDTVEQLLAWFHGRGAIGISTLNRNAVSEDLRRWAISHFPNVVYVETEFGKKIQYIARIVKSINPKASHRAMRIRLSPRYELMVG